MNLKKYCEKCKEDVHCCIFKKGGFVFVGISDAKNIKNKIKKNYNEFLDYSSLSKKTIELLKKDDPMSEGFLRFSQIDKNGRILRLKKKRGKCIFLNEFGICDIYDVRPNICKIYPFWAIELLNKKIMITSHGEKPTCKAIKNIKMQKDIKNLLDKKEIKEITDIYLNIKKENKEYKKNINNFKSYFSKHF